MKTKRAIELAVLMSAAVAFSYWLGYEQGSNSGSHRLDRASSLKQVGLTFRNGRNDLSGPFGGTGTVSVPKEQTE
jgi:hypothetical protein